MHPRHSTFKAVAALLSILAAAPWNTVEAQNESDTFQERLLVKELRGTRNREFIFGPGGKSFAYVAQEGGKEFAVKGSVQGSAFDAVLSLGLSKDGGQLSYLAFNLKEPEYYVFLGQEKEGPYGHGFSLPISISPRGDRLGYGVLLDSTRKRACAVVGGKRYGDFERVGSVIFSSTGEEFAYAALDAGQEFAVRGETKGRGFDSISHLRFTLDGKVLAYSGIKEKKSFIVLNEKTLEIPGLGVREFILRSDGTLTAVLTLDSDLRFSLYRNGEKTGSFEKIRSLVSSEDGKSLAYVTRDNGSDLVALNGTKDPKHFEETHNLALSPDGKRIAYWAVDGDDTFVVCGTHRSEVFDADSNRPDRMIGRGPFFSPDGQKIAFAVRKGKELWWKIIPIQ